MNPLDPMLNIFLNEILSKNKHLIIGNTYVQNNNALDAYTCYHYRILRIIRTDQIVYKSNNVSKNYIVSSRIFLNY